MPTIDYKEIEKRKSETPQQSAQRLKDGIKADLAKINAANAKVYKSPLEQSQAIVSSGINLTPPSQGRVKNYDQDKFEDIIDFISINRADNVPLGDIQNQLLEDYGPDYEELVRHALSKWAE